MAKKDYNWKIYRLRGTLAQFIGAVEAADEATAIKKAIEEFHITDPVMLGQRTMPCGSWRPPACSTRVTGGEWIR